MSEGKERLDWKLSEMFFNEIVDELELDEGIHNDAEFSNYLTEICDEIISLSLDGLTQLLSDADFVNKFRKFKKKVTK